MQSTFLNGSLSCYVAIEFPKVIAIRDQHVTYPVPQWAKIGESPIDPVADPGGGQGGHVPPWPVKNRPKKDGCRARWLVFHVSCPPPSPKFLDPLLRST